MAANFTRLDFEWSNTVATADLQRDVEAESSDSKAWSALAAALAECEKVTLTWEDLKELTARVDPRSA